jgi:hypothetical protein
MEKRTTFYIDIVNPDRIGARAAQKAVLEEIYLVDAKTWRDPLVISPEVITLEHKCSTEIISPREDELEDEDILFFILCNFRVAAFNDKSPNNLVMKIEASFYTSFSVPLDDPDVSDYYNIDLDSGDANKALGTFFAYLYNVNPISNAWPYWREFVQNMSARMGYPALKVPMLEIVIGKKPEKKAKNDVPKKETSQGKELNA